MTRNRWITGTIAISIAVMLGGCGKQAAQPVAITEGVDKCDVCHMNVPDDHNATEIVLQSGKVLKFDDLGCLYRWEKENDVSQVEARFVRDYLSREWLSADEATFVYDKTFKTPMGYGVYSFQEKSAAEAFIKEQQAGKLMTKDELDNHTWESSMKKGMHKNGGNMQMPAQHTPSTEQPSHN